MVVDRRGVIRAACGGCAALALSACGGSSSPKASGGTTAPSSTAGGSSPAATTAIAKLTDIAVGSSISAKSGGRPLLVARPTETTVVAFSAICTHQGCTVEAAGKTFACPCHGSKYDAFTGAVLNGPAPAPLHPFAVAIKDGEVVPA